MRLKRALTSTEAAFTACLIIRCNLNGWGAAVGGGISESQADNGVLFPSELLRTEFFLILFLNVPRIAGILCAALRLTALSFYCNLEPVWKFYFFGKAQMVGLVSYIAVYQQWSLWLGKPHVWVQRPCQREMNWMVSLCDVYRLAYWEALDTAALPSAAAVIPSQPISPTQSAPKIACSSAQK